MNPSPYPAPFKSAHVRANIAKILLIVGALVAVLSVVTESLSLAFPPLTSEQEFADNPSGAIIVLVTFLVAVVELIIYFATVVFFLMWLYRAYNNVQAFDGGRHLNYSPGMAVGSFFIPFANLVIPYRAITQLWQESGPSAETQLSAPRPPALFPMWWLFWLLASFAANISFRLSLEEKVPQRIATMISIGASGLYIVAAALAYLVVDSIDKRQEETIRRINLGKFSVPPPPPPPDFGNAGGSSAATWSE